MQWILKFKNELKLLLWSGLLLPLAFLEFTFCANYAWVLFLFTCWLYFLFIGIRSKITWYKIICFNAGAIFFALFLFEGYLWIRDNRLEKKRGIISSGDYASQKYNAPNSILGYGIKSDGIFTAKKSNPNQEIYNVVYTFKDGLRFTPNSNNESNTAILFFGCSLTFGEGVNDTSTLPYLFNKWSAQSNKIYNYGFHGYGPHRMLASIEHRVPNDLSTNQSKKIAIYSFLPTHISRAAGYSPWDQSGPKYDWVNGNIQQVGMFNDFVSGRLTNKFLLSHIYKRWMMSRKSSHQEVLQTIGIIKKSAALLKNNGVDFYLFFWDNDLRILGDEQQFFIDELKKSKIELFFLHDAIPDYNQQLSLYTLSPDDGHPNAVANEKIAQYLVNQLKLHPY